MDNSVTKNENTKPKETGQFNIFILYLYFVIYIK